MNASMQLVALALVRAQNDLQAAFAAAAIVDIDLASRIRDLAEQVGALLVATAGRLEQEATP